jgi:hypothetical protein
VGEPVPGCDPPPAPGTGSRSRRGLFISSHIHPSALQGAWPRSNTGGRYTVFLARLDRGYAGFWIRTSENTPSGHSGEYPL